MKVTVFMERRAVRAIRGRQTGWTLPGAGNADIPAGRNVFRGGRPGCWHAAASASVTPAYFTLFALATLAVAVAPNVYGLRLQSAEQRG
jgi:hypothetical protein